MDIRLLTQIAIFITLATIFFKFLRYIVKLNLLSSITLSVSMSFLLSAITICEFLKDGFVENIWTIIVLAVLVTIIMTTAMVTDKIRESAIEANNQKKWTVIFRIRKN